MLFFSGVLYNASFYIRSLWTDTTTNQQESLVQRPGYWSLTGFPFVNIAIQCFCCNHHCQKQNLLFCSWCNKVFASLQLGCRAAGGIFLGMCTWWLHGLDRAQTADIWAAVILGNVGLTKFRKNERGEADEPDTVTKLQLARNFKCQVSTPVECCCWK